MKSVIATIPAEPVDAATGPWKVTQTQTLAKLAQSFGNGRSLEYRLPKTANVDIEGNQALVPLGTWGTARWTTFRDHVKFDVLFSRKPPTLDFDVPVTLAGLSAQADGFDLTLVDDAGVAVARVLRPFVRDAYGAEHQLTWALADGKLRVTLPDLADDAWRGAVLDPTTVDTSTGAPPTGYPNQRKVDRCQNGVLWAAFWNGGTGADAIEFWYSTDNGTTWNDPGAASHVDFAGTNLSEIPDCSIFIDLDDYCHIVYRDRHDSRLWYRRGTPNAGRTAWTWSTALQLHSTNSNGAYPDIVAHREGTGWAAHVVYHESFNTTTYYYRIDITSGGVISKSPNATIGTAVISGEYFSPSIDFNHTGDGKTVAGSTPHLYVAATGSTTTTGVRFIKATYSAGAWAWGTERAIDAARYVSQWTGWLVCFFDGTRVVMVGMLHDGTSVRDVMLYERDAADTTTTTRTLIADAATTAQLYYGTATYDSNGDVYLFGANQDEAAGSRDLVWLKWTRATTTLSGETVIDSGVGDPYVSAKRGSSQNRIEILYRDGTASPFNVVYDNPVSLNVAPSAPTWATTTGTYDVAASLLLDWNFVDSDPGDTQSAYALKRDIGGTIRWWDGTDWDATTETWNTSATTQVTLSSGWGLDGDATHNYSVATKDAAGLASTYSSTLAIIPSAKVNPTIDTPAHSGTVNTSTVTPTWTVAQQSQYKLRLLSAADAELWSSGWVTDTAARSRTVGYTLSNSTTYKVELTTKNTEGLESTADTNTFSTSFTPPSTPTLVITESPTGALTVTITNPGAGATEDYNDVFVRVASGGTADGDRPVAGDGIRIATNVAVDGSYADWAVASGKTYQYMARVWSTTGVSVDSAWTS